MSTLKKLYRKKGGKQNADQPFSDFLFWMMSREKNSVNYTPVIYQILKQSIVAIIIFLIRTILFFFVSCWSLLFIIAQKKQIPIALIQTINDLQDMILWFLVVNCWFSVLWRRSQSVGPLQPGNQIICSETEAPLNYCVKIVQLIHCSCVTCSVYGPLGSNMQ